MTKRHGFVYGDFIFLLFRAKIQNTGLLLIWCSQNRVLSNIQMKLNKANLRDLIAATGQDINRQFFHPCDREIWWMTSKNNMALLLYYVKLCASFQIHWWIQTGFTIQKRSIRVEIGDMLSRVILKLNGWPWKTIGHIFYATSSFVQYFVAIGEFKLELQSGNAQSGSNF